MSVSSPLQALRFIALALSPASDPEVGRRIRALLRDGAPDWQLVVRIASEHLVTPALHGHLERRGLLGLLERDLVDYLLACADLNRERNRSARRTLLDLARTLNRLGIRPVALKGCALLLAGVYDDPADRMLGDIDVLLPADTHGRAIDGLIADGFAPLADPSAFRHHHHVVPLARPDDTISVELHREVLSFGLQELLPSPGVLERAQPIEVEGASLAIPSPEDLLMHNLVHHNHTQQFLWSSWLRLRDARDLAGLVVRHPDVITGPMVEAAGRRVGRASVEFYVVRALDLFGVESGVQEHFRERGLLRRTRLRWHLHDLHADGRLLGLQQAVWSGAKWLTWLGWSRSATHRRHVARKILRRLERTGAARK
ncbi:MAG TPA: nucleotidyltransferase family protein [Geminicoccaceae bacterium]